MVSSFGLGTMAIFGPAAQYFKTGLNLSLTQVNFLIAIPALSGPLLSIPLSVWAGTNGGRRPFLIILFLSLAGVAGLAAVVNLVPRENLDIRFYPLLLLLGLLSGCGVGTFAVGMTNVSYWFPRDQQGTALGIYGAIGNLAPGPLTLLLPVLLSNLGIGMSYLIWLGLFSAGILGYLVLGRDAWYFQLRHRGFTPDQARRLAMNYGQELFPGVARSRASVLPLDSGKPRLLPSSTSPPLAVSLP